MVKALLLDADPVRDERWREDLFPCQRIGGGFGCGFEDGGVVVYALVGTIMMAGARGRAAGLGI